MCLSLGQREEVQLKICRGLEKGKEKRPDEEVGKGRAKKSRSQKAEEVESPDVKIFSDEEKAPIRDVEAERQRKREAMEVKDRAELEKNVKKWKRHKEEVEARFEGGPPKKLKVGEQTIGALFSPAALPEEVEEGLKDNDLEIDEDEESKSFYFPEEEPWEVGRSQAHYRGREASRKEEGA